MRAHKIAMLEAQLKNIAYGTKGVQSIKSATDDDDDINLEPGQNLVDITVKSALISPEGLDHLRSLGLSAKFNLDSPNALTSFVMFDFYDFESVLTHLGLGLKPLFNNMARLKGFIDDFFLQYLQSRKCQLEFCLNTGTEWMKVAFCNVIFRDLVEPGRTDKLTFYGDLLSTDDDVRFHRFIHVSPAN